MKISLKKDSNSQNLYFKLIPYIKRHYVSYLILLILLILGIFLDLAFAWFLKNITDVALKGDLEKVSLFFVLGIVMIIANIILSFFNSYLQAISVHKVKLEVRVDLFSHILRLPRTFYLKGHSGDLVSRLNNDVNSIGGAIGSNLLNLIRHPLAALISFIYLLTINWQLSLLALLIGPSSLLLGKIFGNALRKNSKKIHELISDINSFSYEVFLGNIVVKAFSLERVFLNTFTYASKRILSLEIKDGKLRGGLQGSIAGIGSMTFLITLGLGAFFVANGNLTVGSLLAFVSLLQNLTSPFTGMAGIWAEFQRSLSAIERIFSILDEPTEMKELPKVSKKKIISTGICFKDINFKYEKDRVIKDLNLFIPARKVVAIVGPSGAGKSTLFNLMLGLLSPNSGSIMIDNRNIDEFDVSQLRSHIAIVPQETYLFRGSIEDNIKFGNINASKEEIRVAAKAANAHNFIIKFPNGYNTEIGENGALLSGGQKQRLTIARAFLKDTPLLLLDEATSDLDTESEVLIQHALLNLMENKTTLVIAHRLSTIKNADIIAVMDNGKIIEKGSHNELIESNGLYKRLYELQFNNEKNDEIISERSCDC